MFTSYQISYNAARGCMNNNIILGQYGKMGIMLLVDMLGKILLYTILM